jgi:hypothetical protein
LQLLKGLAKKLKLRPQATEAIVLAFVEAQLVSQFQEDTRLLPGLSKLGPTSTAELLEAATSTNFKKETAEDLLAFACTASLPSFAVCCPECHFTVKIKSNAND